MTTALQKSEPAEIISAEQGKLIDRAKVYLAAEAVSAQHQRGYIFLVGATMLTLKDCTPHGHFDELKKIHFPDSSLRTISNAMYFAEAVKFFSKGKSATVADLVSGDRLLTAGDLTDQEKQALIADIEKVNKGGVMKTIQAWHNKKAPKAAEPKNELHAHEEHLAFIHALFEKFEAAALALLDEALLPPIDFATEPRAMRDAVGALCVRVNKRVKQAKRDAKLNKNKKP